MDAETMEAATTTSRLTASMVRGRPLQAGRVDQRRRPRPQLKKEAEIEAETMTRRPTASIVHGRPLQAGLDRRRRPRPQLNMQQDETKVLRPKVWAAAGRRRKRKTSRRAAWTGLRSDAITEWSERRQETWRRPRETQGRP